MTSVLTYTCVCETDTENVKLLYSAHLMLPYKVQRAFENFHPLEVVNHGSETQLQVGEYLNCQKQTGLCTGSEVICIFV